MLISLVFLIFTASCKSPLEYEMNGSMILNSGWSFKMKGEQEWLPAKVPGCVHADLLDNDRIPQPFYRDNEKQLQWIDKNNWIYRCSFELDSLQLEYYKWDYCK